MECPIFCAAGRVSVAQLEVDSDDAAPDSDGGRRVPEAVGVVIASGITLRDLNNFSGSLRLRFFGPRDLTSDGIYRSQATALLNGEIGYRIHENWGISAEFLNLLNRRDQDIDYAYESKVTPTAMPAFTDAFHPVEPFQVRFWLRRTFRQRPQLSALGSVWINGGAFNVLKDNHARL